MKKIMFNDKYGLTDAVIERRKTNIRMLCKDKATKELIPANDVHSWRYYPEENIVEFVMNDGSVKVAVPQYKIGEVVAVAQPYKAFVKKPRFSTTDIEMTKGLAGWNNKMFVRADLMPHQIRITDIKVERMQEISDEDCFREGIVPVTWRQHLQQDLYDLSPQKYIDHNVYTLEKFREGIEDCWAESDPNEYMAEEAKVAFAVLIFKTLGRKVWEQNPYVFVYSFEICK